MHSRASHIFTIFFPIGFGFILSYLEVTPAVVHTYVCQHDQNKKNEFTQCISCRSFSHLKKIGGVEVEHWPALLFDSSQSHLNEGI